MASSGNTVVAYFWIIIGVCLFAHFSAEYAPESAIVGWLFKAAVVYTAVYVVVPLLGGFLRPPTQRSTSLY